MEQVPCEDTELVLAVLEDRLQTLSENVVREGERITMFGLGPSPRAVNPRDTTVIDVRAANGMTLINADVNFTASAFLGELPQDTIVLGKLERVFEELREEVARKTHSNGVNVRTNVVVMEHSSAAHEAVRESKAEEAKAIATVPGTAYVATEKPHLVPVDELRAVASRLKAETDGSVAQTKRRWGWMAVAGVCALGLTIVAARYLLFSQTANGASGGTLPVTAPVAAAAPAPVASTPASIPSQNEDPTQMLKEWESAMQSNNAEAQAAYYADPVDRYITRNNVSRQAVIADKQAAIDKRKEGWTETLDRVKVQRQGDANASVSLVKHFRVTPDGTTVPEWFIPARLQLKRVDGVWRIVAESDLGWVTSMGEWDAE
jgi:ketosteroid isomerase-like protein